MRELCTIGFGSGANQHVDGASLAAQRGQERRPRDLPKSPLQAVPLHSGSVNALPPRRALRPRLRHDQADPRTREGGSGDEDVEVTRLSPLPPSKQRPYLIRRRDPRPSRKRVTARSTARSRLRRHGEARFELLPAVLASGADHEMCTATLAPGVQNSPTTPRRHPSAETMLVDALSIARPIGRLHRNPSKKRLAE